MNILETGIKVINSEIESLQSLSGDMPKDFTKVVELLKSSNGRLIVSGIGKSGYIANKIAASIASTGTLAFYLHPSEASHGDMGMISKDDIVMLLSSSGATKELCDVINYCKRFGIKLIAMTMKEDSLLANNADFLLNIPRSIEASSVAAPTNSAIMMLALGDALMVALHESKGFSKDDFKLLHPGGKIGANLLKAKDLMHSGESVPFVNGEELMSSVLITMTSKGFGVTSVIDEQNNLLGVITDGDLRRNMEKDLLDKNALDVMSKNPFTINPEMLAIESLKIMNDKSITSLFVVEKKKLCGIIHMHDLLRAGVG